MATVDPQHYLRDPQGYAIDQWRYRHDGTMFRRGEYAMFVLMWREEDHIAGLVAKCPQCFEAYGKVAEVYNQPAKRKCPSCFGTTFDGGYKARVVRPSVWDWNEPDQRVRERGEEKIRTASVQSTSDFRLRTGDYIFRGDGERFEVKTIRTNHLRTGFALPTGGRTNIGFAFGDATLEPLSSVAYMIPPDATTLATTLDLEHPHWPQDFTSYEEIRGPLL